MNGISHYYTARIGILVVASILVLAGCPNETLFDDPGDGSTGGVSVTGVALDQDAITLAAGSNRTLVATVSPSDADNTSVSWSSNNGAAATVDTNGVVTAEAAGSATITVTTTDGGFTDTCAVTVVEPLTIQNDSTSNDSSQEIGCMPISDPNYYNRGIGQQIISDQSYTPVSFSVFIDPVNAFKDSYDDTTPGNETEVEATVALRIWVAGDLKGTASTTVSAGTTGEIQFEIADGSTISGGAVAVYGVYVVDAATNGIRGELLTNAADEYGSGEDLMRTSSPTDDDGVMVYSNWSILSNNDLRFTLIGVPQ